MKTPDKQIQSLLSHRNFDDSKRLIDQRLVQDPDSPDAHYLLAVWHYFQSQIGPTVEHLEKTLSLDPRHTDAAICLSVLYNDIGQYDKAKGVFEKANRSVSSKGVGEDWETDRKFSVKHLELADLYFRYRRYDEAIEEYGKAAYLDPHQLDIRIRRAKAFAKKGFLSRAIQEIQQLKKEHPSFLPARIQLGLLYYSQGDILNAELEWEAILDFDPQNKESLAYLEMAKGSRIRPESRTDSRSDHSL